MVRTDKAPGKEQNAVIMENPERAVNNKDIGKQLQALRQNYDPGNPTNLDTVTTTFLDRFVFAPIKDKDGKPTDRGEIKFNAGEHVSNIEMEVIDALEKDYPELQAKMRESLENAGYETEAIPPETVATVL